MGELDKKNGGRGRPKLAVVKSAAERKRAQRERMREHVLSRDAADWSEAACLFVLNDSKLKNMLHRMAWRRIGEIHGYFQERSVQPPPLAEITNYTASDYAFNSDIPY